MKTNIAEYMSEAAKKFPCKRAVIFPESRDKTGRVAYTHLTFLQLERISNSYATEFKKRGIKKGVRVLMMMKPGLNFIASVFAVFKTGAVPVLIDPGMGRKNFLRCIRQTEPEALISISLGHWVKYLFPKSFKSIKTSFSSGIFPPPGIIRLEDIGEMDSPDFQTEKTELSDTAAILFTTGSTGPPKGVVYTHEIFITQLEIISRTYGSGPSEIDMPAFPLFALFSAAMGMSCVIPDMNPTKPAEVDPTKIVETVNSQGVTFSFGSPALWRKVAEFCLQNGIQLPTLKKVLMAGAPVPSDLHEMLHKIMGEGGETMVPYGATESLPITTFTGSEMLSETADMTAKGLGYCVGHPIEPLTVKVIKATDSPIPNWQDDLVLPCGQIGEIVIKGAVVTPEYYNLPEETAMAKITDSDGKLWHRMGDSGYFDNSGRLWFCGRKKHRVISKERIHYPVCCEAIFNQHPDIFRTALVGLSVENNQIPALVIELSHGKKSLSHAKKQKIVSELKALGKQYEFTSDIDHFFFHRAFPVDIRHNAKIFREELAIWAKTQNPYRVD